MVWAIVSIVLPIVGTIVAFVLAARAADSIRRSRGTRTGNNLVVASRVVAGSVIALWAIGLIAFVAFGNDDDNGNKVAVPTQPPITSTTLVPTTSTTVPPTTTSTTVAPTTTAVTAPPTVITVAPPPTEAPTTAPTQPTTAPTQPTTAPTQPTTAPTQPTTTPTTPQQRLTARIEDRIGDSNRGVPADERVVVQYTPGATVTVTWAINNGNDGTAPSGEPTCTSPPPPPTSTTTTSSTSTTSTTTSSTTTSTTVAPPTDEPTVQKARQEARQILQVIRNELRQHKIDATGVQLVGTYPITGSDDGDVDVVQVFYWGDELAERPLPTAAKVFVSPPAAEVQCLNPAFE
jgi:hypothetical protein